MPPPPPVARRWERHCEQRPGSFTKPFCAKNSCSPAVKAKLPPQSLQVKILSVYTLALSFVETCLGSARGPPNALGLVGLAGAARASIAGGAGWIGCLARSRLLVQRAHYSTTFCAWRPSAA